MSHKTWSELAREFIDTFAGTWDIKTQNWYHARFRWWLRFTEDRELKPTRKVTGADLNRFGGYLKQAGLKYSTRKDTLGALKTFTTWLHRKRLIKQNPFHDLDYRPPREERDIVEPITISYARLMIHAAEQARTVGGFRDAAIMRILLTTGLRREEVAGLSLGQVDLDTGEFFVRGKFNHRRRHFFKVTTLSAIKVWLSKRPQTSDQALFVSLDPASKERPHELRPDALNELLTRWRDRAGLSQGVKVGPHRWRHLFATEMSMARNPFALQLLMGHKDIATTNGYMHPTPAMLRELVEQYAPDVE